MSKIGKKPIIIPEGVKVQIADDYLEFAGENATLRIGILPGIAVYEKDNQLVFEPKNNSRQTRANWGTMRALAFNALQGSMRDFVKELKIEGIGYRAAVEGDYLVLNVGFSHPVKFHLPPGIKASVEKNIIKISGADKFLVGETASRIRKIKKPEPYKGTGIMYSDEVIRRKAGKKAAASE